MSDETAPARPPEGRSPPVLAIGEIVADTYEVRTLLGSGGMGEVYEAHDRSLNRRVALKVVRPHVAPHYLRREGQALAAIHHPSIVAVHSMGTHRGVDFLVLERVYGVSLEAMLVQRRARGERFLVSEAIDLLIAIADGLHAVHRAGLSHRDVKPSNVMLAPGGRIVLMDFGLVLPHIDAKLHSSVAGSLEYMAPESLTGDVVQGAAHLLDLYSLGVLGYRILAGIVPFGGDSPADLYRSQMRGAIPSIAHLRGDVPAALDALLRALMEPNPAERPQSAESVVWQLRSIRDHHLAASGDDPFAVLIVDDDRDMWEPLTLYVRVAAPDAHVETAADAHEALRAVRRHVPHLLLLDLDLPDMNGVELCMLLRGMQLGDRALIVSISGCASEADVALLDQLGVRFFEKGPDLMPSLVQLVQRIRPAR